MARKFDTAELAGVFCCFIPALTILVGGFIDLATTSPQQRKDRAIVERCLELAETSQDAVLCQEIHLGDEP